jgi:hypothetical protein
MNLLQYLLLITYSVTTSLEGTMSSPACAYSSAGSLESCQPHFGQAGRRVKLDSCIYVRRLLPALPFMTILSVQRYALFIIRKNLLRTYLYGLWLTRLSLAMQALRAASCFPL